MRSVVIDDEARVELRASLDEIVREGVRRMLAVALEAEAGAYVAALVGEVDERGHRLVVRNGCARERTVTTVAGGGRHRGAAGARPACRPGERAAAAVPQRDRAAVVLQEPEGGRGTPAAVPAGLSSGDFVPALTEFFGSGAGLSASVITRLIRHWQDERTAFARRRLHAADYVYVCADGVHFNVRLEEERLCCLVIVGVRADSTKELVAIVDGYRESTASWVDLLRDLKRRGMRAPVLAVGDGALREVFPATRDQRCWVHKLANVLDALPKSAQPTARRVLVEIRDTEDRDHAVGAVAAFAQDFAKSPKAVTKVVDDAEALLAFLDFPAEHWVHLKTTNPIESTFVTVRLRIHITKEPGSRGWRWRSS